MCILWPVTDNCPSWIRGRERKAKEIISWPISMKECCQMWGLNQWPSAYQTDADPSELPYDGSFVSECHVRYIIWATSWENLFLPYANNKGADQPAYLCSLIRAFIFHCLDSLVPLVSIPKISSFKLASVGEQAGLRLTWSQTPKTGFSWRGSYGIIHLPLTPVSTNSPGYSSWATIYPWL